MKFVLNIKPKDPKFEIEISRQVDAVVAQLNRDINGTVSVEEIKPEPKPNTKKGGSK